MAQRHFLVTINAETSLDANDVQDAIVDAILPPGEVSHGDVDVSLVETLKPPSRSKHFYNMAYRVLDAV